MEILVTALIVGLFAALGLYAWSYKTRYQVLGILANLEREAVDLAFETYEVEKKRLLQRASELENDFNILRDNYITVVRQAGVPFVGEDYDPFFDGQDVYDTDDNGNCLSCGVNHDAEEAGWPDEAVEEWNEAFKEAFNGKKGEDIVVTDRI